MQIKQTFLDYQKKPIVRGAALVVVVFFVALGIRSTNNVESIPDAEQPKPLVEISSANSLNGGEVISLLGTVRAFTEAKITAERGGRVVAVNTKLGARVSAGQTIAVLENASERAAVLQAEGVYEAALAASAQSGVGVTDAENNLRNARNAAVSAGKSAYNTTNGIVLNSVDQFFSSPNGTLPGLRIDGKGFTGTLNQERVAYQALLPSWQSEVNALTINSDLVSGLEKSRANVSRTIVLLDTFLNIFNLQDANGRYSDAELQSFSSSFTTLRSTLLSTQASLDNSITSLQSAEDALSRAKISASGGTSSAADAQIKQALGSLRSAQANLAKTILRTPISGTVNSLDLQSGDFVTSFQQVAVVANNAALEIVTYVGDSELNQIAVGEKVLIEGKYEGLIVQIAPAIDEQTRKTEVRIAVEGTEISNGDTVRVTKQSTETVATQSTVIWVPLTAIKFNESDGYTFVVEDGKLIKKDVVIGSIRGTNVQIIEGLSAQDEFVVDVRGLTEGDEVTVKE